MATVIAIDLSVSMLRDIKIKDTKESFTLLQLATHGVNVLLDYLAVHSRLEFVAVVSVKQLGHTMYQWLISPYLLLNLSK